MTAATIPNVSRTKVASAFPGARIGQFAALWLYDSGVGFLVLAVNDYEAGALAAGEAETTGPGARWRKRGKLIVHRVAEPVLVWA